MGKKVNTTTGEGFFEGLFSGNNTNPTDPENGKSGNPILDTPSPSDARGIGVNTITEGFDVNEYKDYYKPGAYIAPEFADSHRASNQSWKAQLGNSLAKFVPNTLLTIGEQLGYVADLEDYSNVNNEVGNWLSNWAKEQKTEINKALPIYRENAGEALDFGDSGWWFENGNSLVESATAFIATAYLTRGATLKLLNKGNQALKWLGAIGMDAQAVNKGSTLLSTLLMNQAESAGIGVDVYNQKYEEELKNLNLDTESNLTEKQKDTIARQRASESAAQSINFNRVNMLLNLSSVGAVMRSGAGTRNILSAPTTARNVKRVLGEGIQEAGEETINMLGESYGLTDGNYGTSDMLNDIFTKEGLESALLGFVGGAGQTGLTSLANRIPLKKDKNGNWISSNTLEKQRFLDQQNHLNYIDGLSKAEKINDVTTAYLNAKNTIAIQNELIKASEEGDTKKVNELSNTLIANQAYQSFQTGTTERLIDVFKGISNMSEEEAEAKGLDVNTYKEKSKENIEFIEELEKEYIRTQGFVGSDKLFSSKATILNSERIIDEIEKNNNDLKIEVYKELNRYGINTSNISEDSLTGKIGVIEDVGFNINNIKAIKEYNDNIDLIQDYKNKTKELSNFYNEFSSDKNQKQLNKQLEDTKKQLERERKEKEIERKRIEAESKITEEENTVEDEVTEEEETEEGDTSVEEDSPDSFDDSEISSTTNVPPVTTNRIEGRFKFTNKQRENDVNSFLEDDNISLKDKIKRLNTLRVNINKLPDNDSTIVDMKRQFNLQVDNIIKEIQSKIDAEETSQNLSNANEERLTSARQKAEELAKSLEQDIETDEMPDTTSEESNFDTNRRNVNLLFDLLDDLSKSGIDTNNFNEVAKFMNETLGSSRFANIYEHFRRIYNSLDPNKEEVTDSYDDIFSTLKDKRNTKKNINTTAKNALPFGVYTINHQKLDNDLQERNAELAKQNGINTPNPIFAYDDAGRRVVEGNNKLAYLSKDYDVIFTEREDGTIVISKQDIDNKLRNLSIEILDPTIMKEGDTIKFVVLEKVIGEDGTIYMGDGTVIDKEGNETKNNPVESAPIGVIYNGKLLNGVFVHQLSWINSQNVAGDVNKDREKLIEFRQKIIDTGSLGLTTTIKSKSFGSFMYDAESTENKPVSEVLPNINKIVIGKDGIFYEDIETPAEVINENKSSIDGATYIIVPTHKGNFAHKINRNKLNEQQIDSIVNAIDLYLTANKNHPLVQELSKKYGINILTYKGLSDYVNSFTFVHNGVKTNMFSTYLNSLPSNVGLISIKNDDSGNKKGGVIQFGKGLSQNYNAIDKEGAKDNNIKTQFYNNLRRFLADSYFNIDLNLLKENEYLLPIINNDETISEINKSYVEFVKENTNTNLVGVELENGNTTYTTQHVIEFDTNINTKAVKSTETTNKNSDVEQQKADIERRRQEELEKYANDIVERVEDYEVIDNDGDTLFVQVRYKKDGSKEVLTGTEKNNYGNVAKAGAVIGDTFYEDIYEKVTKTGERTGKEANLDGRENKINAKYDAELDALESQLISTTSTTPTTTITKKGRTGRTFTINPNDNVDNDLSPLIENDNNVNYNFKIISIISNNLPKIYKWSKQIKDQDKLYQKIQQDLGIPKDQVDLLKNSEGNTIGEKLSSFIANYSYTVEINTAKEDNLRNTDFRIDVEELYGKFWIKNARGTFLLNKSFDTKEQAEKAKEKYIKEKYPETNTQHYSNLTVPGGTNYTENEIATPAITPSIKGHAQFSTDNGIGWFRSDDKVKPHLLIAEFEEALKDGRIDEDNYERAKRDVAEVIQPDETKTRRILELQSDLFQKGRGKELLILKNNIQEFKSSNGKTYKIVYNKQYSMAGDESSFEVLNENDFPLYDKGRKVWMENPPKDLYTFIEEIKKTSENQFLQLLNKDNNWVTFFVKSIIQDSAKKGYEKVLFPKGDTASKIEGHSTLEEFKKQKEDRIEALERENKGRYVVISENNKRDIFTSKERAKEVVDFYNKNIDEDNPFSVKSYYEYQPLQKEILDSNINEINQLKQELERVEKEGFAALRPIYNFYENTVANILKKQGFNPVEITDKYGNKWNEISLENVDTSIDLSPLELSEDTTQKIIESTTKTILIPNLPLGLQLDLVNEIASDIFSQVNQKGNLTQKDVFDNWLYDLKNIIKPTYEEAGNTKMVEVLDNIITNYDSIKQQVNAKLSKNPMVSLVKRKDKDTNEDESKEEFSEILPETQDLLDDTEDFSDDSELEGERNPQWNDGGEFRIDPKATSVTKELKLYLDGIPQTTEGFDVISENITQPKIAKGIFGLNKRIPFDTVFNDIMSILSTDGTFYMKPNFDMMVSELESMINEKSYLYYVLNDTYDEQGNLVRKGLKNAPENIKNLFVHVMSKNYSNHLYLYSVKNNETGLYSLIPTSSDRNNIINVILNNWENNLKTSKYVKNLSDDDDRLVITNKEEIENRFKAISEFAVEGFDYKLNLLNWLNDLGIDLPMAVLEEFENGIYHNDKYIKLNDMIKSNNSANSFFNIIKNNFINKTEDSTIDIDSPLSDSVVKVLAKFASKYEDRLHSISGRDIKGRQYYWYNQNKFLIDRLSNLKNDEELITKLAQQSFTQTSKGNITSLWLNDLAKYDEEGNIIGINKNSKFYNTFNYFTVDGESYKGEGGKKITEMSDAEYERFRLGLFMNQGNQVKANYARFSNKSKRNTRPVIKLFHPTTSDKSTLMGFNTLGWNVDLDINNNIPDYYIDILYKTLVLPEILRIREEQQRIDNGNISNIKGYGEGYNKFYFIPELNNLSNLYFDNDINGTINTKAIEDAATLVKIKEIVRKHINNQIKEQIADWRSLGLLKTNENGVEVFNSLDSAYNKNNGDSLESLASNYVFNYLIGNAEIYKLFIGDPALYYKKDIQETFINIGKRLASHIAPGMDLAEDKENPYFKIAFIEDRKGGISDEVLRAYKNVLSDKDYKEYANNVKGTDAQEFTTLKEHLKVLRLAGRITKEQEKDYLTRDKNGIKFNNSEMRQLLQPMKPRYVNNIWRDGKDVKVYIKSSSIPLFKQFTKGLEIDKLREAMENDDIDRVAFSTAVKVGNVNKPLSIFNKDGSIKNDISFKDKSYTQVLPREGFKLQQEIPYDETKSKKNDGTQKRKLITVNLQKVEGFFDPFSEETLTGKEIREKIDGYYNNIFKKKYDRLNKKLLNKDGTLNLHNIKDILIKEAVKRNYPINDIESLQLVEDLKGNIKFITPLWSNTLSTKMENLLNSIIDNKIRKIKVRGNSFVLGTEEGFSFKDSVKEMVDVNDLINKSGIIVDKEWLKESGGKLRPMIRKKVGNKQIVTHDEIFVPAKFFNQNGKLLSISNFTDSDGFIDFNKISPELLEVLGYRIPTQGLNSMARIKIVGILPESMGDIVIAPRDFTVRMGSDFDIDKLYIQMYNAYQHEDGNLSKFNKENTIEHYENRILDLHLSVMSNPADEVYGQIITPLGFGMLKDSEFSREFDRITAQNNNNFSGLSPMYQRQKFLQGRAGKTGIGVFSMDSVFNALIQGKDIRLTKIVREEKSSYIENVVISFGNLKSNFLNEEYVIGGKRYKSDVISAFQSAAVDNENEQLLDKYNINSSTFDVIRVLMQSGFEEDIIIPFINQPIVKDYINLNSKVEDNVVNIKKNDVLNQINEKYNSTLKDDELDIYINPSKEEMMQMLADESINDFAEKQQAILKKFIELEGYGKSIQEVQSAINSDSKGIGKDLLYTMEKVNRITNLYNNSNISNADTLIGDYILPYNEPEWDEMNKEEQDEYLDTLREKGYVEVEGMFIKPTTINGFASIYGTVFSDKLYSSLYPYKNIYLQRVFKQIKDFIGVKSNSISINAEEDRKIWNSIKSYLYSANIDVLTDGNLTNERNRLLIKTETNQPLAYIINDIKKRGLIKNNPFINRLTLDLHKVLPSNITYDANSATGLDETYIYAGFIDLIQNNRPLRKYNGIEYDTRKLAQDLITLQFINGGVQKYTEFIRYIPINYLTELGFFDNFNNINFNTIFETNNGLYNFTRQYIQHNPNKVAQYDLKGIKYHNKQLSSFEISNSDSFRDSFNDKKTERFIAIPDVNINGGYRLYEKMSNGNYNRIDTLGYNYKGKSVILEYNYNSYIGESIVKTNKSNLKIPKIEVPIDKNKIQELLKAELPTKNEGEVLYSDTTNIVDKYKLNDNTVQGRLKIGSILAEIGNSNNVFHSYLANELLSVLENIPNILINIDYTLEAKGQLVSVGGIPQYITINPDKIKGNNEFEKVFLEELVHTVTKQAIKENKKGEVLKVNNLRNEVRAKIAEEFGENIFDKVEEKLQQRKALNANEMLAYRVINNEEFTAGVLIDENFKKYLENKKYKDTNQSIIDRIGNLLLEILEGLGIKSNTYLKESILTTLSLIDATSQTNFNNGLNKKVVRTPDFVFNKLGLNYNESNNVSSPINNAIEVRDFILNNISNLNVEIIEGKRIRLSNKLLINKPPVSSIIGDNIENENNITRKGHVVLPSDYNGKDGDIFSAIKEFKKENPDGIIAYRVNNNKSFLQNFEEQNAIGNPFNWQKYGGVIKSSQMFKEWLETGNNFNEELATKEYRDAIIENKPLLAGQLILYYKELGKESHANILDNFINSLYTNTQQQSTSIVERGRYVNYQGDVYIITKINSNGTIQIYNPTREGNQAKKSVAEINIQLMNTIAKFVEYRGIEYMVTPQNNIISLKTNTLMKWDENNGDRKVILKKLNELNNTVQGTLDLSPETDNYIDIDLYPITDEESYPRLAQSIKTRQRIVQEQMLIAEANKDYSRYNYLYNISTILDNQLEEVSSFDKIEDLIVIANQDFESIDNMFKRDITSADIKYAEKVLNMWSKSIDLFFTDDNKTSPVLLQVFGNIVTDANLRIEKLNDIKEKVIEKEIKRTLDKDINITDYLSKQKDTNVFVSGGLDITRVGNIVLDTIHTLVGKAFYRAKEDSDKINRNFEDLLGRVKNTLQQHKGNSGIYEIFRQKFDDGRYTGDLINKFSPEYFEDMQELWRKYHNKAITYSTLLEKKKDRVLVFDVRKLFGGEIFKDKFTEEEREAHKQEIKELLGDTMYNQYMKKQEHFIKLYTERKEEKLQSILSLFNLNEESDLKNNEEARNMYNEWLAGNSPFNYLSTIESGKPSKVNGKIISVQGYNYVLEIPKKYKTKTIHKNDGTKEIKQIDLGYYDNNFSIIENNPDLLEFYNFITNTIDNLKIYFPGRVQETLQFNGLPEIKKNFLENFGENGSRYAIEGLWNNLKESLRTNDISDITYAEIDPLTGEVDKTPSINIIKDRSSEYRRYIERKRIEYKQQHNEAPTEKEEKEWKRQIKHELSQKKSYDLGKIIKIYSMAALSLKYKNNIAPTLDIAQSVLNNTQEYERNPLGEILIDGRDNSLVKKPVEKSFKHIKSMLDSYLNHFYGNVKELELSTSKKTYTLEEKRIIDEIEELKKENQRKFNSDEIEESEYENTNNKLESQLEDIGGTFVGSRVIDGVLKFFQLKVMGWNFIAAFANMGFGFVANTIESSDGRILNEKDLLKGYRAVLGSIGKNMSFNTINFGESAKIRALMNNGDFLSDSANELYAGTTSTWGKTFKFLSPFNPNSRTEYVNQAPLMYAIYNNTIVKDLEGNDKKMWEGFDTEGNWKKGEFGEQQDLIDKTNMKIRQIIAKTHGNYDSLKPLKVKRVVLGRALSMFRTWMFEGFANRFEEGRYDEFLGIETKGRYRSYVSAYEQYGYIKLPVKIVTNLLRKLTFQPSNWDGLNEVDSANMRKNLTEIILYGNIITFTIMLKAIAEGLGDDDEERPLFNWLINQSTRIQTDIRFYVSPEGFKTITKDPIPVTSLITDWTNWSEAALRFIMGDDEIGSGVNAGSSRLGIQTIKNLPLTNQWYRNYNSGRQLFNKKDYSIIDETLFDDEE